jgi:hypothetical protein
MALHGYFIQRADPLDPSSALEFFPPKGSDELHEALKLTYPLEKNLQARMRQAVIDFLLVEKQQEMVFEQFATPTFSDSTTPDYLPSPLTTVASTPMVASSSRSSDTPTTVPSQEQLMNVWMLPSKPEAKVHRRRCMSDAEKAAYKQKRLEGACGDCKRKRRKCTHGSSTISSNQRRKGKRATQTSPVSMNPSPVETNNNYTNFLDLSFDSGASDSGLYQLDSTFDFDTSAVDLPYSDFVGGEDFELFPQIPQHYQQQNYNQHFAFDPQRSSHASRNETHLSTDDFFSEVSQHYQDTSDSRDRSRNDRNTGDQVLHGNTTGGNRFTAASPAVPGAQYLDQGIGNLPDHAAYASPRATNRESLLDLSSRTKNARKFVLSTERSKPASGMSPYASFDSCASPSPTTSDQLSWTGPTNSSTASPGQSSGHNHTSTSAKSFSSANLHFYVEDAEPPEKPPLIRTAIGRDQSRSTSSSPSSTFKSLSSRAERSNQHHNGPDSTAGLHSSQLQTVNYARTNLDGQSHQDSDPLAPPGPKSPSSPRHQDAATRIISRLCQKFPSSTVGDVATDALGRETRMPSQANIAAFVSSLFWLFLAGSATSLLMTFTKTTLALQVQTITGIALLFAGALAMRGSNQKSLNNIFDSRLASASSIVAVALVAAAVIFEPQMSLEMVSGGLQQHDIQTEWVLHAVEELTW